MTDETSHGEFYRDATEKERKLDREGIFAAWEAGDAYRKYSDSPSAIGHDIGRSDSYVSDRIAIADRFNRHRLEKYLDTHPDIRNKTDLLDVMRGYPVGTKRADAHRRNVRVPIVVSDQYEKAYNSDFTLDMGDAIRHCPLSELRIFIIKHGRMPVTI